MNLTGRVSDALKHLGLIAALGIVVLAVILSGLGFLICGLYVLVSRHMNAASAAAITGGVLIVLAAFIGLLGSIIIRKLKKPQPSLLSEFGGTFGLGFRLMSLAVRRDPRKAVILAAVAGVIAEYLTGGDKKS